VSLSTHVLDTTRGEPAVGVRIRLERHGRTLAEGVTDADGRLHDWVPEEQWSAGSYRLVFDTGAYFAAHGIRAFFPDVTVAFDVTEPDRHHHVPLLLSPFSYTTYRGS
jgi:5-hydroxyisourate hydrolase